MAIRVLLADDHALVREGIERILNHTPLKSLDMHMI